MQKLKAIITGLILSAMLSPLVFAATAGNVKDLTGLGTNVGTTLTYAVNAANGVPRLDSGGKFPASVCPAATSAVAGCITAADQAKVDATLAISGSTPADTLACFDGTHVISCSAGTNITIASGVISAAGGTGAAISGVPAAGNMVKFGSASSVEAATAGVDFGAAPKLSLNGVSGYLMPTSVISDAAATLTLGTALPQAYPTGVWQYVQANQIKASIVAAWRWTLMSTTTLGQICQETYDPTTQIPYIPASCTAFTDAVPGTITGLITTYVPWVQVTVPANSMGKNGKIITEAYVRTNNSADSKLVRQIFGTTNIIDRVITTSTGEMLYGATQNSGVTNRQRSYYRLNMGGPTSITASTEDTTTAKTYTVSLRINAASSVLGVDTLEIISSGAPQ